MEPTYRQLDIDDSQPSVFNFLFGLIYMAVALVGLDRSVRNNHTPRPLAI